MNEKRLLAIACMLVMLMSLFIGCGNAPTESIVSTTALIGEHYKFSMMTVEGVYPETNEIYKALAKKFNLEFIVENVTWDDWGQKSDIAFAVGDIPDIMQNKLLNMTNIRRYQQAGVMHALPDLAKYPFLNKVYLDNQAEFDLYKIDGKLWFWPRISINNEKVAAYLPCLYRWDWAKKLGYNYKRIQVLTLDEAYALAADFAKKDPGGNGVGQTWGMGFFNGGAIIEVGFYPENIYSGTYKKVDGKYIWGPSMPETLASLKKMKAAYDAGAIHKDFYSIGVDPLINNWLTGKMGMFFDFSSPAKLKNRDLVRFTANNPDFNFDEQIGYLIVTGSNGSKWQVRGPATAMTVFFNSRLDDQKIDRIFQYIDYTGTDEGSKLCLFGLPGIDWKEEGGKIVSLAAKNPDGSLVHNYIDGGRGLRLAVQAIPSDIAMDPNIDQKLKDFHKEMEDYLFKLPAQIMAHDIILASFSAPNKDKYGSLYSDLVDEVTKIIVSVKAEEVEKEWDAWLTQMQPKVDAVLKEINEGIR